MTVMSPAAAGTSYVNPDVGWANVRALCHDLRQPLAAILMLCSSGETTGDAAVRQALDRIEDQATFLADMVRQVVEEPAGPVPVVVGEVVGNVVRAAQLTAKARLEYHASPDDAFDIAMADATRLHRAVANLVDNAVRAAGPGGLVRVRVTADDAVEVLVEDDGPGFGHVPGGTGLGLAIVREVADELGGVLQLGSSALGGALARLRIPTMSPTSQASAV